MLATSGFIGSTDGEAAPLRLAWSGTALGAPTMRGRSLRSTGPSCRPSAPVRGQSGPAGVSQARVYADYRQLLDREQLDVVDVVLPSDLHYEVGRKALQSGCTF